MPLSVLKAQAKQYVLIAGLLAASWLLSQQFSSGIDVAIFGIAEHAQTLVVLFMIVLVLTLGFIIYEVAKPTIIPSFVLTIFFGIVTRDLLSFIVERPDSLTTLITIGAILILFEGGLDTPFIKFKTLIRPILALALLGTLLNAFLLGLLLMGAQDWTQIGIPLTAAVLLGAAIASTDPAAIIPCLQGLRFKNPRVKHIAISESAINDVVGAVIVGVFLAIFNAGQIPASVADAYTKLLTLKNLSLIVEVISIGTLIGVVGFGILHFWSKWKERVQTAEGTDAALFLAVPIFAFTASELLGGNGYLAVFLAGLLFHIQSHFKHVEHYFNHTIEGFMKPMIFMLLGAMVSPAQLMESAPLGIFLGIMSIFVLRPLIVLLTLSPFSMCREKMTWKELAFLSFVRETGVIPAALLITMSAAGVPGAELAISIGLWVILLTLVIQPPLTPLLAKQLHVASDATNLPNRQHLGPVAVLCSRGYSFPERMQTVVEWALQHSVDNIALLHCPEERYTDEFVNDVQHRAETLFASINATLREEGKSLINFEFLCGPGLLQENIEKMIASGDVSIIFVGSKMLDYRLEDVKRLQVPFYFM